MNHPVRAAIKALAAAVDYTVQREERRIGDDTALVHASRRRTVGEHRVVRLSAPDVAADLLVRLHLHAAVVAVGEQRRLVRAHCRAEDARAVLVVVRLARGNAHGAGCGHGLCWFQVDFFRP